MAQESLVRTLPGKNNFFLTVKVFYKLPHICLFSSLGNTRPSTESNKPFAFCGRHITVAPTTILGTHFPCLKNSLLGLSRWSSGLHSMLHLQGLHFQCFICRGLFSILVMPAAWPSQNNNDYSCIILFFFSCLFGCLGS